jgi:hypothetical protein
MPQHVDQLSGQFRHAGYCHSSNWKTKNMLTNTAAIYLRKSELRHAFLLGIHPSIPQLPKSHGASSSDRSTQHPTNRLCHFASTTVSATHQATMTYATQQKRKKATQTKGVARGECCTGQEDRSSASPRAYRALLGSCNREILLLHSRRPEKISYPSHPTPNACRPTMSCVGIVALSPLGPQTTRSSLPQLLLFVDL